MGDHHRFQIRQQRHIGQEFAHVGSALDLTHFDNARHAKHAAAAEQTEHPTAKARCFGDVADQIGDDQRPPTGKKQFRPLRFPAFQPFRHDFEHALDQSVKRLQLTPQLEAQLGIQPREFL